MTSVVGELRPSQALHTFGVGSVVDLPRFSAVVLGLEFWQESRCTPIVEERLLARVRRRLGPQVQRLLGPPVWTEGALWAADVDDLAGLPVAPFPGWMRCPACELLAPLRSGLFQASIPPNRPDKAYFFHENCNRARRPTAVPARFLLSCARGHLDDFPWSYFVHRGQAGCQAQTLRLAESGISGEASEIYVKCETCSATKRMGEAFGDDAPLPSCRGRRPHLRDFEPRGCDEREVRTILLGASNSWFPLHQSILHVPPRASDRLGQLVEDNWAVLSRVTTPAVVAFLRGEGRLGTLAEFDDDEVFAAVERRRTQSSADAPDEDLKLPEWRVLIDPASAPSTSDFEADEVPLPRPLQEWFSKLVLVQRLREVSALIGFTRLYSPRDLGDDDPAPDRRASLSRQPPTFAPAAEVRGEGLFLQFREERVAEWCARQQQRDATLRGSWRSWRRARNLEPDVGYPGVRFALLHTFAHGLLRSLSLEAGYSCASLRERIYSAETSPAGPMAGVLVYTAAPDSEGTLGGLVRMGREIGRHVVRAIRDQELCSSDPLCADRSSDGRTALNGAACHACLFAPETSCERGNSFLDRRLLVTTVMGAMDPFFPGTVSCDP